jgi:branched-chain amino acid transport system substrate-binding protein
MAFIGLTIHNVAGKALVARGDDTWFFITVDYMFGHTLERETTNVVRSMGGQVLGAVRAPINTQDFSSFLLQRASLEGQSSRTCQYGR